ncbi:protocatechuate 3,4-dioxygenase subunit alpha [Fertoeibacter niger]|nr:protocatechuate 3,4-dioxygenase subunit alpha [Fertoeibacter niger]
MQNLHQLKESPSQTAGPYVHIGCMPNFLGNTGTYPVDLGVSPMLDGALGQAITITGRVIDGAGMVLRDVMIESWQADAAGHYPGQPGADANVTGWARFAADFDTGFWTLHTIKPGRAPAPNGQLMTPHIALWIVARGINIGLQTRICFADEAPANAACPVLARVEHKDRIATLLAHATAPGTYSFDIHLQGDAETVFFDI